MDITTNLVNVIHNGKSYQHSTRLETVYLYIGEALKNNPQIAFQIDGSVSIMSCHHTDEKKARIIRKVIKSAGGTVESKTWWGGEDDEVVKRKKDATRYSQEVRIRHGKTTIKVFLFVDLA